MNEIDFKFVNTIKESKKRRNIKSCIITRDNKILTISFWTLIKLIFKR